MKIKYIIIFIVFVLLLFICSFVYFYEPLNVDENSFFEEYTIECSLLNNNLETIIPFGTFDRIFEKDESSLRVVKKNDKYGFIDDIGNIVIPIEYDNLTNYYEGLARFEKNNKFGFIDINNKTVIPNIYDYAHKFIGGYTCVAIKGNYGVIDKNNKIVLPLIYCDRISLNKFSEDRMRVKKKINGRDKYGYIDKNFKIVLPIIYDHAFEFSDGYAGITENNIGKKIDKTGKEINTPSKETHKKTDYKLVSQKNKKINNIGVKFGEKIIVPYEYNDIMKTTDCFVCYKSYLFNKYRTIDIYNKQGDKVFSNLKYRYVIYNENSPNLVVLKRNYFKVVQYLYEKLFKKNNYETDYALIDVF